MKQSTAGEVQGHEVFVSVNSLYQRQQQQKGVGRGMKFHVEMRDITCTVLSSCLGATLEVESAEHI